MRYVSPDPPHRPPLGAPRCADVGHTWPRSAEFNRVTMTAKTRRFPLWRRLLGLPQKCHRCGVKRYY